MRSNLRYLGVVALLLDRADARGLDPLVQRITERPKTHRFSVIFENELERVWPTERKETAKRAEAIHTFATANDLLAKVQDPGLWVTFKKLRERGG